MNDEIERCRKLNTLTIIVALTEILLVGALIVWLMV